MTYLTVDQYLANLDIEDDDELANHEQISELANLFDELCELNSFPFNTSFLYIDDSLLKELFTYNNKLIYQNQIYSIYNYNFNKKIKKLELLPNTWYLSILLNDLCTIFWYTNNEVYLLGMNMPTNVMERTLSSIYMSLSYVQDNIENNKLNLLFEKVQTTLILNEDNKEVSEILTNMLKDIECLFENNYLFNQCLNY